MMYSIVKRTAWKLWADTLGALMAIGFFMLAFTVVIMAAGTLASIIITVCDACGVHWWPDHKVRVAHAMSIIGPLFWIIVWIAYRVRQSIKELSR